MKKIFAFFLIGSIHSAQAQVSIGMHTGSSNKNFVAGLHAQYQFKNRLTAGFNITAHIDNENPAFFQSRFGYTLGNPQGFSVQPYMGYSYRLQNVEQKNYGSHFATGAQFRYALTDIAVIYADLNLPDQHYSIFSIGIAGRLLPHHGIGKARKKNPVQEENALHDQQPKNNIPKSSDHSTRI